MRWDDAANARVSQTHPNRETKELTNLSELFAAIMSVYQILPQGKQVEQIAKFVGPGKHSLPLFPYYTHEDHVLTKTFPQTVPQKPSNTNYANTVPARPSLALAPLPANPQQRNPSSSLLCLIREGSALLLVNRMTILMPMKRTKRLCLRLR